MWYLWKYWLKKSETNFIGFGIPQNVLEQDFKPFRVVFHSLKINFCNLADLPLVSQDPPPSPQLEDQPLVCREFPF